MTLRLEHRQSWWGIYSACVDIKTPTVSLCASVLWTPAAYRGWWRKREGSSIWIADKEEGAGGGKGQWSLCVKEEVGADIQVYLSVSLGLMRARQKGHGSSWPVWASLSPLNNGILSDAEMRPVCHFYSLIFCHFCLCCVRPTRALSNECMCAFLLSDCDLQSGWIVPAAAPRSWWYLPATFHFTPLTSSGSDR